MSTAFQQTNATFRSLNSEVGRNGGIHGGNVIQRRMLFLALILAVSLVQGCSFEPSKTNTYPCDVGVFSRFDQTIRILDCEGMGYAYPSGLISKTSGLAPTKTFFFPRQRRLPERFTIHWQVESEKFSQELPMPMVKKGSDGMLRFELSSENEWSLTFEERR